MYIILLATAPSTFLGRGARGVCIITVMQALAFGFAGSR